MTDKHSNLSKISIVTPSFNQGEFLAQTIESVISQEGDFFIDYIVADGGSTDESVEIIKKYERLLESGEYPVKCRGVEYRWWSRPDNGQSEAINQGLALAEGVVLAWMNSDDYYEPRALARVLKVFEATPDAAMVHGACILFREETGRQTRADSRPGDFGDLLREDMPIYQPSAFFTRDIIDKVGPLDENLNYAMDHDLWLRIFSSGKVVYLPEVLSSFRFWAGSKTSPQQEEAIFDAGAESPASDGTDHFLGKTKDYEYLLEKYSASFKADKRAHATRLRRLGTMYLLAGNRPKSIRCFLRSIRTQPSPRNIVTFLLALFGKTFYYWLLVRKRKAVKDAFTSA
jgi:glycosyltransferase involved in cell wall biosynthesis